MFYVGEEVKIVQDGYGFPSKYKGMIVTITDKIGGEHFVTGLPYDAEGRCPERGWPESFGKITDFEPGDMVQCVCRGTKQVDMTGEIDYIEKYPYFGNEPHTVLCTSGHCYEPYQLIKMGGNMNRHEALSQKIKTINEFTSLKMMDDILTEIYEESDVANELRIQKTSILVWTRESKWLSFKWESQCEKLEALKSACHHLLEGSCLKKSLVGQTKQVDIEGKIYKAKIIEEVA